MRTIPNHRSAIAPLPLQVAIVWIGWFMLPTAWNQVSGEDVASPSWKTGVSTWNGKGYELPPVPQQPSLSLSGPKIGSSVAPYTVPVDPSSPLADPETPFADLSSLAVPNGDDTVSSAVDTIAALTSLPEGDPKPTTPTESIKEADVSTKQTPVAGTKVETPKTSTNQPSVPTMSDAIVDGDSGLEVAPLQEQVVRWYQYPAAWMKGWDSHAEFGLDGSSGNADTLALQTGLELRRQTDHYTIAVDIDYRNARNQNLTIEDNGRFNLDVDRMLKDTPWSSFGKFGMEWDKFKAFDLRLNVNGGLGYHFVREDDAALATRFGAGASKEIGAPDDDWVAEAVFGLDAMRQINSRHKVKAKVDYFPAWEDFGNYRLVADASWEILLDDTDNFSLKLAATDRYDSTPQGAKHNDVYYSLLLLYKF